MPLKLKLSEFNRNALTISKGTLLSQIIIVGATPILTRLYGPESFGKLALFSSAYTILAGIFSARWEQAIYLPKDDAAAMRLMRLTLTLSLGLSTGLLALLVLARSTRIVPVAGYLLFLPAAIFAGTVYSVMQNWFSRRKRFVMAARSGVLNAAANAAFCFLLFFALPKSGDQLVYAYSIGLLAAAVFLSAAFLGSKKGSWRAGRREMLALAREYAHFPRYMVPTALLGILSYQLIPILLKQFYPLGDVGYYAIANRFLFLPSILLGTSIAEVFRVEIAARSNAGGDLGALFRSTLRKMIAVGGPAFLAILLLAPLAFRLILGRSYLTAGVYAQYLCVGVFGQFLIQPFGYVYVVRNRIRTYFVFQAALTVASILAIVAGHALFRGIAGSLLLFSAATIAIAAAMLAMARRVIRPARGEGQAA